MLSYLDVILAFAILMGVMVPLVFLIKPVKGGGHDGRSLIVIAGCDTLRPETNA